MAAVIYSEGDFDVLAEDGLGAVVLAAGRGAEECVRYLHFSTLRERDRDLDDGSRHVDGDGILSRVVRDRVDGCTVLAKCIVDAVTAGSRVGKSDLGRAVVCVRFLGARKTDGTRDS